MSKSKVYGLMDLGTKLMVINFIWFLTLITGMVVITLFPATAALFITIRKLLEDSLSYSEITKVFMNAFFKNFLKFSVVGLILVFFFLILSSNFIFIINYRHIAFVKVVLQPIMIFIALCGFIVLVNTFIINVYETISVKELIVTSVKNGLKIPFNGLIRFLLFGLVAFVVFMFPGLLPVISMNVFAVLSIWIYPKPSKSVGV